MTSHFEGHRLFADEPTYAAVQSPDGSWRIERRRWYRDGEDWDYEAEVSGPSYPTRVAAEAAFPTSPDNP